MSKDLKGFQLSGRREAASAAVGPLMAIFVSLVCVFAVGVKLIALI